MTVVALDGPAGAGKSTVARLVADELGWRYLDTGAMYRAVALAALSSGVPLEDGAALADLAASAGITVTPEGIRLAGVEVSRRIRDEDVTATVSLVSSHPEVRAVLAAMQRAIARGDDVVIEGRDIATAVAPEAEVKVFLTAELGERAKRRWAEGSDRHRTSLEEIRHRMAQRDREDSTRAASPLARAEEAILVDTTDLDVREVVARIVRIVRERVG